MHTAEQPHMFSLAGLLHDRPATPTRAMPQSLTKADSVGGIRNSISFFTFHFTWFKFFFLGDFCKNSVLHNAFIISM